MPEMGLSGLEGGVETKTSSLPLSLKPIFEPDIAR
jgi:hypothetical protein